MHRYDVIMFTVAIKRCTWPANSCIASYDEDKSAEVGAWCRAEQADLGIIERFGKFDRIAHPGKRCEDLLDATVLVQILAQTSSPRTSRVCPRDAAPVHGVRKATIVFSSCCLLRVVCVSMTSTPGFRKVPHQHELDDMRAQACRHRCVLANKECLAVSVVSLQSLTVHV